MQQHSFSKYCYCVLEIFSGKDSTWRKLGHVCVTFFVTNITRLIKLLEEIMGESENKSLIFTETKRRADELTRRMRRDGYGYSYLLQKC